MDSAVIGWSGMVLCLFGYILLNTKKSRVFTLINGLGSALLTIHAFMIWDVPFILLNGIIMIMLIVKEIKGGVK